MDLKLNGYQSGHIIPDFLDSMVPSRGTSVKALVNTTAEHTENKESALAILLE